MSLFTDYIAKLDIARDPAKPRQTRLFAFAELVFVPVSLLSVAALVVLAILRRTGLWTPPAAVSAR